MNERLQKIGIATDAFCDNISLEELGYWKTWESKFYELIVRDAMDYASRNWENGHLLAEDLRVHFGIEKENGTTS